MHSVDAAAEARQWHASAERWRVHALRTDSLGETARRKHTKALHKAWVAENDARLWASAGQDAR